MNISRKKTDGQINRSSWKKKSPSQFGALKFKTVFVRPCHSPVSNKVIAHESFSSLEGKKKKKNPGEGPIITQIQHQPKPNEPQTTCEHACHFLTGPSGFSATDLQGWSVWNKHLIWKQNKSIGPNYIESTLESDFSPPSQDTPGLRVPQTLRDSLWGSQTPPKPMLTRKESFENQPVAGFHQSHIFPLIYRALKTEALDWS